MARVMFAEVLDGRSAVKSRVRLDSFPATIGRGYANDLILDDPYVCPQHARVFEDAAGALMIEDMGSVNGLYDVARGGRASRVAIAAGTQIRVGHSVLRFCDPEQAVAATMLDREQPARAPRLASAGASAAVCVLAFALFALTTYLGSFDRQNVAKVVSGGLTIMVGLAVWAGCWALASRIVSHRFNFLAHWALASAVMVAISALGAASEWAGFLLQPSAMLSLLGSTGAVVLVAVLFYGHLTLASGMSRRLRWRSALVTTGVIVAVGGLAAFADHGKFSTKMTYEGNLKPVSGRWVRTVTVDVFEREARDLQREVDALAAEK